MSKERLTLGIETSCDETAAAVFSSTRGILSNKLFSQIDLHREFGGVVPEIASRSHLEKINIIIEEALQHANTDLSSIDTVAVTNKPGLPGSLLIGLCFAKAIAATTQKHLIGVNHLEGHAFSSFLDATPPFPHLCITASGGHTSLYLVRGFGDYDILGQTVDDAAGEAFDKIAKLLNLPYPGGPVIEKLAREANFEDFYGYSRKSAKGLDFSFSGLKTAVLYDLVDRGMCDLATKKFHADDPRANDVQKEVASSLLVCISDIFKNKLAAALKVHSNVKAISFVGGVACNKYIKEQLNIFCQERQLSFFSPAAQFCTDNAAMIAFVGNYKAEQGKFSDLKLDILD
jgi:N6-L-threonylcarbamoyladenine synthase